MTSSKQQDEKNVQTLRELMLRPGNRKCMDCTAKGPVAAVTDFGTFVCQTCAGIHREFSHRVKMISMATFKTEEIEKLKRIGNENARRIWLAKWQPSEVPEPEPSRQKQVRDFMRAKYVEKRWYDPVAREALESGAGASCPVAPEPLQNILGSDIPPLVVNQGGKRPTAVVGDLVAAGPRTTAPAQALDPASALLGAAENRAQAAQQQAKVNDVMSKFLMQPQQPAVAVPVQPQVPTAQSYNPYGVQQGSWGVAPPQQQAQTMPQYGYPGMAQQVPQAAPTQQAWMGQGGMPGGAPAVLTPQQQQQQWMAMQQMRGGVPGGVPVQQQQQQQQYAMYYQQQQQQPAPAAPMATPYQPYQQQAAPVAPMAPPYQPYQQQQQETPAGPFAGLATMQRSPRNPFGAVASQPTTTPANPAPPGSGSNAASLLFF